MTYDELMALKPPEPYQYDGSMQPQTQVANVPGLGVVSFVPGQGPVLTDGGQEVWLSKGKNGEIVAEKQATNNDSALAGLAPVLAVGLGGPMLGGALSGMLGSGAGYGLSAGADALDASLIGSEAGAAAGSGSSFAPAAGWAGSTAAPWTSGYDLSGALTPSATSGGALPPGAIDWSATPAAEFGSGGPSVAQNLSMTQAAAPVADVVGGAGLNAPLSAIQTAAAVAKTGLTAAQVAQAAQTPGMIDKILSGTATATDLAKIGLGAAAIGALATEDPDRASTTKVEYPDWYNAGSKSALGLADQFAALGPNSVAPLSANENAGINLAASSTGNWQPTLDQSNTLATKATGGIPSVDLSAYMNPYLDNVLTPIIRRNQIAKSGTLNDINAKAGMRGAFGGSRNDLLTNLASESADRNMNEAEANIRSGAFTTGLTAAQNDLNRMGLSSGQLSKNASTIGALTGNDISNLTTTGALPRNVEQAKLNAPLTAIGGYATALRGNPGSTTTAVAPEASKLGQGVGALTALLGANKAGWI